MIRERPQEVYALRGVAYSYLSRFAALRDIDLLIGGGDRVALVGANGSGKSTLLMLLAGLIFAGRGECAAFGRPLNDDVFQDEAFRRTFRSRVGIVFQNPDIQLFNSTVADELAFGLAQQDIGGREAARRIDRCAQLMGVTALMDRHPQWLSVGEKKRVAIASVLVLEPEVLLLDEPTAGLDPKTTRHLLDALAEDGAGRRTMVTATQDLHIVPEIADRVVVLSEEKRIVREAAPGPVMEDIDFLTLHNLVHIHAHRHKGAVHVHPHEHKDHH